MIRGRLSGTVEIQDSKVVIVVESGTVLSTYRDSQKIGLRPVIAGRGIRDARRVAEAKPQSIGKFASGESRELQKSLKFRIPLPADFDPANQWLVFQFLVADGSSTFVCETGNLAGAYSRQLLRPGAVCWANPDS